MSQNQVDPINEKYSTAVLNKYPNAYFSPSKRLFYIKEKKASWSGFIKRFVILEVFALVLAYLLAELSRFDSFAPEDTVEAIFNVFITSAFVGTLLSVFIALVLELLIGKSLRYFSKEEVERVYNKVKH